MTIQEIISLIQLNKPQYGITLYPPASDIDLTEFENSLKIKLPHDIAEFYKFANGFESGEDMFRIIPLNEILDWSDKYNPDNTFYIAEYMIYCDMWEFVLNPFDGSYKIQDSSFKTVLTDSFAEFLQRFLKGGVFETEGLYDWADQIKNRNQPS